MIRSVIWGCFDNGYLQAAAAGLEAAFGFRPRIHPSKFFTVEDFDPAIDIVLMNGMRGGCPLIKETYERAGVPVMILDAGFHPGNLVFNRLTLGELNWLAGGPCRDDRAKDHGLEAEESKSNPDGPILLLGQAVGDPAHGMPNFMEWAKETLARIRAVTNRPVKWRCHPKSPVELKGADIQEMPRWFIRGDKRTWAELSKEAEKSLAESVAESWAVVCYNSTAAIEVIKQGVGLFCDSSSLWAEAGNDLSSIEPPNVPIFRKYDKHHRQSILNRIAYTQWNQAEMSTPAPWLSILNDLGPEFCEKHGVAPTDRSPIAAPTPDLLEPTENGRQELARIASKPHRAAPTGKTPRKRPRGRGKRSGKRATA